MFEGVVKNYRIVRTVEGVNELLEHIENYDIIAYDTEDTGLNVRKDRVIGFSVSGNVGDSFYFPILQYNPDTDSLEELEIAGKGCIGLAKKILTKLVGKKLIMHNASYDCRITKNNLGIDLLPSLYVETILLIHTVQEEGVGRGGTEIFGLKKVAIAIQDKIGLDVEKAANEEQLELWQSIKDNGGSVSKTNYEIFKADPNILGKYAAADTDLTLRIYHYYLEKLVSEGLEKFFFEDEVMPVYKEVTIPMEDHGVKLDMELLEKTKKDILVDMEKMKQEVIDTLLKDEPGQRWVIDQALKTFPVSNKGTWASAFIKKYELNLPKSEKTQRYSISKSSLAQLEDGWQKEFLATGNAELVPEKERIRISLELWKERNDGDYFNVQSASQLADIVFNYYGEKSIKISEDTGKDAFDKTVILELSKKHPWCEKLRIYRKLQKIYTTYVERFLTESEDGVYYPYFKQNGTVSGRYASNLQQLPHPMEDDQDVPIVVHYNHLVRQFLIARPGYKILDADYESLEPHCFASVSGDEGLRDIFRHGHDFYSTVAIKTEKLDQDKKRFPDGVSADKKSPVYLKKLDPVARQRAKSYSLGLAYGMSAYALGKNLRIPTKEAQKLVDGYFEGFPELKKWYDNSRQFTYENGFIRNYLGRYRHLPQVKMIYDMFGERIMDYKFQTNLVSMYGLSKEEVSQLYSEFKNGRNNCLNFQLQSLGAGIVNRAGLAIVRKAKELGIELYPLAQIHDQWCFDVEESGAEIMRGWVEKLMAETTIIPGVELTAPCEIARNLYEGH